jgi:hypothetical protein
LFDAVIARGAQGPVDSGAAFLPGGSESGCGVVVRLSPELAAGAGAIAAGEVGVSDVPTRNPADKRKIAADNMNPMELASTVDMPSCDARTRILASSALFFGFTNEEICAALLTYCRALSFV